MKWEKVKVHLLLLIVVFCFIFFFSTSTSPLYSNIPFQDSNVFQVLGKGWLEGKIPYRDLVDNKGPLLYAINAIGYYLTGNRYGIQIIQGFCLWISVIYLFKILNLKFNTRYSFILTTFALFALSLNYSGGNTSEEYTLPFLTFFYYSVLKFIVQNRKTPLFISNGLCITAGLSFGICVLTLISHSIGILAVCFCLLCKLWHDRQYNRSFQCIGIACTTAIIILLPFSSYFIFHKAWEDAIFCIFTNNFSYLTHCGFSTEEIINIKTLGVYLCAFANCYLLLFLSILKLIEKKDLPSALTWILASICIMLWFLSSNTYPKYAIVCFPFFGICFLEIHELIKSENKMIRIAAKLSAIYFVAVSLVTVSYESFQNIPQIGRTNKDAKIIDTLMAEIPRTEIDSLIFWSDSPSVYINYDILPSCKYFCFQSYSQARNPELYQKIIEEYKIIKPKWILVDKDGPVGFNQLHENYHIYRKAHYYDDSHLYTLYKLNP